MKFVRTVETDTLPEIVAPYLSDFTTTTEWDPGTVTTERVSGDGGEGTRYRNVSKFLGRKTELTYVVVELEPGRRIALVGSNKTVTAHDTMMFEAVPGGTKVTYEVEFQFQGAARLVAPLLRPALGRLADKGREGMQRELDGLTSRTPHPGPPGRPSRRAARAARRRRRHPSRTGRLSPCTSSESTSRGASASPRASPSSTTAATCSTSPRRRPTTPSSRA